MSFGRQLEPEAYAKLAGRDFVNIFEEHSGVYCHVVRVLPDQYRTPQGESLPGLVVNEFRLGYDRGKKVRSVVSASGGLHSVWLV